MYFVLTSEVSIKCFTLRHPFACRITCRFFISIIKPVVYSNEADFVFLIYIFYQLAGLLLTAFIIQQLSSPVVDNILHNH